MSDIHVDLHFSIIPRGHKEIPPDPNSLRTAFAAKESHLPLFFIKIRNQSQKTPDQPGKHEHINSCRIYPENP
jgi:hypothetical protein